MRSGAETDEIRIRDRLDQEQRQMRSGSETDEIRSRDR
jgi:hypothetical protein